MPINRIQEVHQRRRKTLRKLADRYRRARSPESRERVWYELVAWFEVNASEVE